MKVIRSTVLASVALLALAPALADDAALMQEMRDRAAIEALMWRYVRALDSLDADAYAAAFTPEGTFTSGRTTEKGTAELKKMVTGLQETRAKREAEGVASAPMYHVIFNHSIEFLDRDHARYDAYWSTMFGPAGEQTPLRVAAVGRSVDMLVRVNGQWLIQSRDVAPK
jgi:uncharacterized protein (TIGR02246 family)